MLLVKKINKIIHASVDQLLNSLLELLPIWPLNLSFTIKGCLFYKPNILKHHNGEMQSIQFSLVSLHSIDIISTVACLLEGKVHTCDNCRPARQIFHLWNTWPNWPICLPQLACLIFAKILLQRDNDKLAHFCLPARGCVRQSEAQFHIIKCQQLNRPESNIRQH